MTLLLKRLLFKRIVRGERISGVQVLAKRFTLSQMKCTRVLLHVEAYVLV
nr:hypothetical protein Iba_scaffold14322CG0010 [Ipomoea batatas]